MDKIPTPHNSAKLGDIANTVIMPGDPLRAKYIADNFLQDVSCYNEVRGMLGYTGYYKGIKISVQGSGMGCPSMGIYSRELFEFYGVNNIIRVGSAGKLNDSLSINDVLIATRSYTNSNYVRESLNSATNFVCANEELLEKSQNMVAIKNANVKFGPIYTSDVFYAEEKRLRELANTGVLAVEMETAALYANAVMLNKRALSVLTISDDALTKEGLSSIERQNSFNDMIKFVLELAANIEKE
ncbi:MAG: purine-nucleoside phosphorylase [Clostridia bacterium]|nr:purine-nucleoside phosphorylase [Clostridia bacterium]